MDQALIKDFSRERYNITAFLNKQDYAYQVLKDMIIENRLAIGTPLVERHISEQLNVSRTPTRGALLKLMEEGLLEFSGRVMVVAPVYKEDIMEVYSIREVLDSLAIDSFMDRITVDDIKIMYNSLIKMEKSIENKDFDKYIEYDNIFHNIYIKGSFNSRLISMLDTINDHVVRFRYLIKNDKQRVKISTQEHRDIFDAVVAGDKEAANHAVYVHMHSILEYYVSILNLPSREKD